jgi:hypothetical protein
MPHIWYMEPYSIYAIAMELPQGLEPWTSLSSISNLNHFAKSTCVCAHENCFTFTTLMATLDRQKNKLF